MDPVLSHHTAKEKQPAVVQELPNNQPHQSPKQSHAEDQTEQLKPQAKKIIAEEQASFRAGRSTNEQMLNPRILCEEISRAQAKPPPPPWLHRLQKGLQQGLASALWATMKK